MNPADIEQYLRRRMGPSTRVRGLRRIPVGLSRQTWIVDLGDRCIVVRTDQAGGASAVPTPLKTEYELHRRLAETGLPVARALWFEDDPTVFGAHAYVREYIEGNPSVPGFEDPDPSFDDVRIQVSMEHARKMAAVHAVDWQALNLPELLGPAPASPAQAGVATVDRILGKLEAVAAEPLPLAVAVARRLRELAPREAAGVLLCKGSNGAMQEIWRDGRIVGLSDWELASLGDPANDWARCHGYVPTIPGRWDEQHLLDYYAEVSGNVIDPQSVAFYRHVYSFEMTLVGAHSALPVIEGSAPDARLAYLASSIVHPRLAALYRELL